MVALCSLVPRPSSPVYYTGEEQAFLSSILYWRGRRGYAIQSLFRKKNLEFFFSVGDFPPLLLLERKAWEQGYKKGGGNLGGGVGKFGGGGRFPPSPLY